MICCFKLLNDWCGEEHGVRLLRSQQGSVGRCFQSQILGWMWTVEFNHLQHWFSPGRNLRLSICERRPGCVELGRVGNEQKDWEARIFIQRFPNVKWVPSEVLSSLAEYLLYYEPAKAGWMTTFPGFKVWRTLPIEFILPLGSFGKKNSILYPITLFLHIIFMLVCCVQ